jgi:hypothetical protein
MKTHPLNWLAALALLSLPVSQAEARPTVSLDYFYENLQPHGDWVEVEDYGYCFRPFVSVEDPDWRPYSEGYWTETEAGWTWVSEEDFGWATYHYGRWVEVSGYWTWVPGYQWAPAWVSWRRNPEYVGWAPLPPEAEFTVSIGFHGWVDSYYDIGPRCYNFVPVRHFGAPRCRTYLVDRRQNVSIINRTTNITNITYRTTNVTNVTNIYNGGPNFDDVNRDSERKIKRLKLEDNNRGDGNNFRNDERRNKDNDTTLTVFAPDVNKDRKDAAPAKVKDRVGKDAVDRGWKQVDQAEAKEVRQKFAEESSRKAEPADRDGNSKKGPDVAVAPDGSPVPKAQKMDEDKSVRKAEKVDDLPKMAKESRDNDDKKAATPDDLPKMSKADREDREKEAKGSRPSMPETKKKAERDQLPEAPKPAVKPKVQESAPQSKPSRDRDEMPKERKVERDQAPKFVPPPQPRKIEPPKQREPERQVMPKQREPERQMPKQREPERAPQRQRDEQPKMQPKPQPQRQQDGGNRNNKSRDEEEDKKGKKNR